MNVTKVQLTERETEILSWIKEGKNTGEIANTLSRTERTINFHIHNIKAKLNASTRAHAVAIAIKNRLIDY